MSAVTEQQHASSPQPLLLALQRTQERNRELENYIKWEERLFSNPHLSATHKLTLIATRRAALRGQTHDAQGRTRLNLNSIAERIGVSSDTVGRNLKYLATVGVVDRQTVPEIQENGERWTRVYASFNNELLQAPEKIIPETPRNHGGNRYRCQHCGSEQVIIKRRVTLICKCCQHESLLEESEREQELASDQQHASEEATVQTDDLQDNRKPVTPLLSDNESDGTPESVLAEVQDHQPVSSYIDAAATLLLALAGPSDEHIEMSKRGPKKYYTMFRKLTHDDLRDHLHGGKARGALCQYPDGQTRGLAWDADSLEQWASVEEASQQLAHAGYMPILEPSPAGRGGHLWILFDALVVASEARQHVYELAPALKLLDEYWPGPLDAKRWNKVRLPGGRYVRPDVNAWCQLISVGDGETSQDEGSAAQLLVDHQTPASLVPPPTDDAISTIGDVARTECQNIPSHNKDGATPGNQGLDSQWHTKYGQTDQGKRLWFVFTPAYVAAWYNARNNVNDLLTPESTGYGLASWRGERTASVAFRGDQWTDFGASAKRDDGTQDSGDALELQTRLSQEAKSEVLRRVGKELVCEARSALECAARNCEPIPAWLEEIITEAGRAHFERIRTAEQSTIPANEPGGVTGFLPGQASILANLTQPNHEQRQLRETAVAVPSSQSLSTEIQTLIKERNLIHSGPCLTCACELYRDLYGEPVCCRCYPQKGYHQYSEWIDVLYPRKKKRASM